MDDSDSVEFDSTKLESDVTPNLVTRAEWGALPPKPGLDPMPLPARKVSFSCDTDIDRVCFTKEECCKAVREIQRRHMEEHGLKDIKYSFLIGDDNNIYEGRGWDYIPQLQYEDEEKYERIVDIAYIGVHEAKYLHWSMYESMLWLKRQAVEKGYLEEKHKDIDFCDKEDWATIREIYKEAAQNKETEEGSREESTTAETPTGDPPS